MTDTNHWWSISGDALMGALHQVADGADPDTVYEELRADSEVEPVAGREEEEVNFEPTIVHGDSRLVIPEVLPHWPKIDCLLTDPPYGVAYQSTFGKNKADIEKYQQRIAERRHPRAGDPGLRQGHAASACPSSTTSARSTSSRTGGCASSGSPTWRPWPSSVSA